MDEHKETGKGFSYRCYRVIRWLVKVFYPKTTVEGMENLPEGGCILVGNHAQMNGPICGELYIPGKRKIWCAAQMMSLKDVPDYAYQDFWSGKPKYIRWFYRVLSYLIAPLSVCVFNNARTIPVYHDSRLIATMKQTLTAIQEGERVIIFPEHRAPHNHVINDFQDRFIDVARHHYKRTGGQLPFVPVYLAPKLKKIYIGNPTAFCPDTPIKEERRRICDYLMDEITRLAVSAPRHIIVPYDNIPKGEYPVNVIPKEMSHEKTGS